MRSVKNEWDSFEKSIIPIGAPEIQRIEMRRAFYAGATSLLQLMLDLGEDDVTEDGGMMVIEGLRQECRAFFEGEMAMDKTRNPS